MADDSHLMGLVALAVGLLALVGVAIALVWCALHGVSVPSLPVPPPTCKPLAPGLAC